MCLGAAMMGRTFTDAGLQQIIKPEYVSEETFREWLKIARTLPSLLEHESEAYKKIMASLKEKVTEGIEKNMPVTEKTYRKGTALQSARLEGLQQEIDVIQEAQETLRAVAKAMGITLGRAGGRGEV